MAHTSGQFELKDPSVYELQLERSADQDRAAGVSAVNYFRSALSIKNAYLFCRLRWVIIAILALIGGFGFIPIVREALGLKIFSPGWIGCALLLSAANIGYRKHLLATEKEGRTRPAEWNLRIQIVIDLTVLTVLVHLTGSIETFAPFFYLLHIVLACIFFSRKQSALTLLLAFLMYLSCLFLEATGALPATDGIFADPSFRAAFTPVQIWTNAVLLFGIWVTIWYLASSLAHMIYIQERELSISNQRLLRTQTEKAKHMLRTTHELKAPFAAIHANAQLLLNGYFGALPAEAIATAKKIADRAHALSGEIQTMLQLANLSSVPAKSLKWSRLDLADVITQALAALEALATEKQVEITSELRNVLVFAVKDHLEMLFANLIANAIHYSRPGGAVSILLSEDNGQAVVKIADQGIGIAADKLPRIFEEYYRTEEAVAHNKQSSGLGLAIVRQVAQTHRIAIRVESVLNQGTVFTLRIKSNPNGEAKHGSHSDRR